MDGSDGSEDRDTRPRTMDGAAAARTIAEMSDDESDDEVRPAISSAHVADSPAPDSPRSRSPAPSDRSADQSPRQDDRDGDRDRERHGRERKRERELEEERSRERDYRDTGGSERRFSRLDSYQREVTVNEEFPGETDIVFLPPSVPFPSAVTCKIDPDTPMAHNPIMYRLRPEIEKELQSSGDATNSEKVADFILQKLKECNYDPTRYPEFLESNARLVTWSDGSRTMSVGKQSYPLVEDEMVSNSVVMRRGNKIQTFHTSVSSVAHLQPTAAGGDSHAKLVMAKVTERAGIQRGATRMMLRTADDDAERKEQKAQLDSLKRSRERALADSRKRNVRNTRPSRPESHIDYDQYESTRVDRYDSSRSGHGRMGDAKRRRLGGSRHVDGSDEEDY